MNTPSYLPIKVLTRLKYGGPLGDLDNCLYLPAGHLKSIGLQPGLSVTFKLGSLCRQVTVERVHSGSEGEAIFFLSPDISLKCELPAGTVITVKYDRTVNTLCAGPLIGLFTVRNTPEDSTFGSHEPSLMALANSASKLFGFVFVFCPEDLDWDRSMVTGYVPAPDQEPSANREYNPVSWKPLSLPLPDVIYNRIPSRSVEARPEVEEAKSRLLALFDAYYFNPMFLDKWETHNVLRNIAEVAEFLPPTKLVETPEDIRDFLEQYGSVFLKPSSGSLGRRIIKVQIGEGGHYRFMYRSKDKQTVEGLAASFATLYTILKPVMGKRTYVVQQDLHLARFEDCPFDIRVLVQKDMRGNWRRTKIYVRKAAPDSFLSNLSDGARPRAISTVLKEVFKSDFLARDGLGEDIRNAVRLIPPALEKGTALTWGELGLDLGIDYNRKIWLIEINSKPFRALVSDSGSFKIIERSLLRPLEFAKFLAGFYRHSPVRVNPEKSPQEPENF